MYILDIADEHIHSDSVCQLVAVVYNFFCSVTFFRHLSCFHNHRHTADRICLAVDDMNLIKAFSSRFCIFKRRRQFRRSRNMNYSIAHMCKFCKETENILYCRGCSNRKVIFFLEVFDNFFRLNTAVIKGFIHTKLDDYRQFFDTIFLYDFRVYVKTAVISHYNFFFHEK